MTPKDKAKQLYDQFVHLLPDAGEISKQDIQALSSFAVDEIIDAIDWHEFETPNKEINYWLDVRKEIVNN